MPSLADFPRVPLTFGPSPVHRLERLSEHLGGQVEIWAKREDCNSGLAYGGNKVRKLEYLAADALAQGCDTLVSIGGVQSNHTRQVAAVAAHLGLACVLVQEHWVDWDDPGYESVGNILLSRIMGADVRLSDAGFDIGFRQSWEEALHDVGERGGKPYPIPAGASDHPLGGHGFAGWAGEVADQEAELGIFFDTIVVCSVTGSTQAGMIAGFAGQERERTVLGIDGSATVEQTWDQIARIARRTAEAIGLGRPLARRGDRPPRRVARRHLRHPGREDDRGDPPLRAARGDAHRPRLRGEVDGGADRPRPRRPHRAGLEGALRAPRRPAGAERLRGRVRAEPADGRGHRDGTLSATLTRRARSHCRRSPAHAGRNPQRARGRRWLRDRRRDARWDGGPRDRRADAGRTWSSSTSGCRRWTG